MNTTQLLTNKLFFSVLLTTALILFTIPTFKFENNSSAIFSVRTNVIEMNVSNNLMHKSLEESNIFLPIIQNDYRKLWMAFTSRIEDKNDIFLVTDAGTDLTNVTNTPLNDDRQPLWSHEGTMITFTSERKIIQESVNSLALLKLDGLVVTYLTDFSIKLPQFTLDDKSIVFLSWYSDPNTGVPVTAFSRINIDGSGFYRTGIVPKYYYVLGWSPNGEWFILSNGGNLYRINADGTNKIQLTYSGLDYLGCNPKWANDSSKIVFCSFRDNGNKDIFIMNNDGTSQINLTKTPEIENFPSFSPDKLHVAYLVTISGDQALYVISTNGSNPIRLTPEYMRVESYTWAPNSKKITFSATVNGEYGLAYSINIDGSGLQRIDGLTGFGFTYQP
ncbi:MAG: PD40 domain-containing protein [Bacteroidales bacterium]|nr:PD40 domain-containing protein [Bacteroidales bacterium]